MTAHLVVTLLYTTISQVIQKHAINYCPLFDVMDFDERSIVAGIDFDLYNKVLGYLQTLPVYLKNEWV